MASIYKPKGSNKYRIAYLDENRKRKTTWGYKDKEATKARAKALERDAERKHAGLRTTTKTSIIKAKIAYKDNLLFNNASASHRAETARILDNIIHLCNWHYVSDANNAEFTSYLNNALKHRAPRTRNRHQETLRAFLNFCCRMDWLEENPIARLKMTPVGQAGRRHHRRHRKLRLPWRRSR